ncbi:MAG: transposase [Deltaproteobacteria bacterium]|nr:transposase [Deltaproteobacteria bacterium]
MKGERFSQEKIIGILKEAECKTSTIDELCRKHGVSDQTFFLIRRSFVSNVKRLS